MIKQILFITMLLLSLVVNGQSVPVDPEPGCNEIQRIGTIQQNNQNTAYFIGGPPVLDNSDVGCDGVMASIGYGNINPDEFAYGVIDADLIIENGMRGYDFTVDLAETFLDMPIGGEVKVTELYSSHQLIADLTLKKNHSMTASQMGVASQSGGNYRWEVTVKWYNSLIEDTFYLAHDDVLAYNFYVDTRESETPIAVIQIGRRGFSINPNYGQAGIVAQGLNSGETSYELETYFFGVIETNVVIPEGDQIFFDLNWTPDHIGSQSQ